MSVLTGLFIIILAGLGIAAITEIAKAVAARSASTKGLAELKLRPALPVGAGHPRP